MRRKAHRLWLVLLVYLLRINRRNFVTIFISDWNLVENNNIYAVFGFVSFRYSSELIPSFTKRFRRFERAFVVLARSLSLFLPNKSLSRQRQALICIVFMMMSQAHLNSMFVLITDLILSKIIFASSPTRDGWIAISLSPFFSLSLSLESRELNAPSITLSKQHLKQKRTKGPNISKP